jgi:hypothetical protein
MNDFFVFLTSNTNLTEHPNNTASEFICHLPEEININFNYKVAIWDLILPPIKEKEEALLICIYSDIVSPSILSSALSNVLKITTPNRSKQAKCEDIENPVYLPVSRTSFQTISILLTNQKGEKISVNNSISALTLHFKDFSDHA